MRATVENGPPKISYEMKTQTYVNPLLKKIFHLLFYDHEVIFMPDLNISVKVKIFSIVNFRKEIFSEI